MANAKTQPSYQDMNDELETIIADLQREDTDVDQAVKQYKRGLELIQQLEKHLKTAENTVQELKAKFSTYSK